MNVAKMKVGYQIPVRRIYRLTDDKSTKDLDSARSKNSANNVLIKQTKGSKFSLANGTAPDKENKMIAATKEEKIPLRSPLVKRQTQPIVGSSALSRH
tara:strand:+ start:576 stop:869 length:294 start_codon:yes stop_codon:yes gene_type:complete